MQPPSDFILDPAKVFRVSGFIWRGVPASPSADSASVAELRDEARWTPNRTYVWINDRMYLRESLLLQAIDRKDILEQIMRENPEVTCLCHFKYKGALRDVLNQGTQIKWHDRKGRPITHTVTDLLSSEGYASRIAAFLVKDECYVFEYCDKNEPRFLYNTTKMLRLGEPSWLL